MGEVTFLSFEGSIIRLNDRLIAMATKLLSESYFGPCVTVAHTAVEVAITRAITELAEKDGNRILQEVIAGLLHRDTSPSNDRIRNLYELLSGNAIQKDKPLWAAFQESTTRRNNFAHRGEIPTRGEAEKSLNVCCELIDVLRVGIASLTSEDLKPSDEPGLPSSPPNEIKKPRQAEAGRGP